MIFDPACLKVRIVQEEVMKVGIAIFGRMFVAAALGLSALSAHAVLLNPGANEPLPGTDGSAVTVTVLENDTNTFSFSAGSGLGDITGTVQQLVVRAADGTLDFYWQVTNAPTSAGAIGSFRVGNFVSPEYDAGWLSHLPSFVSNPSISPYVGDKAPDAAQRFTGAFDSYVNFNFDVFSSNPNDGVLPGQSSKFFFFDTTATDYFKTKTAVFDVTNMAQNSSSGLFPAYSPAPIPEPETYAMMLAGLGVLGVAAKRRKWTSQISC
jgi:hypothetical protein